MTFDLTETQRRAVDEGEPVTVRLSDSETPVVLMQQARFVALVAELVEAYVQTGSAGQELRDAIEEDLVNRAWKRAGRRAIARRRSETPQDRE